MRVLQSCQLPCSELVAVPGGVTLLLAVLVASSLAGRMQCLTLMAFASVPRKQCALPPYPLAAPPEYRTLGMGRRKGMKVKLEAEVKAWPPS